MNDAPRFGRNVQLFPTQAIISLRFRPPLRWAEADLAEADFRSRAAYKPTPSGGPRRTHPASTSWTVRRHKTDRAKSRLPTPAAGCTARPWAELVNILMQLDSSPARKAAHDQTVLLQCGCESDGGTCTAFLESLRPEAAVGHAGGQSGKWPLLRRKWWRTSASMDLI